MSTISAIGSNVCTVGGSAFSWTAYWDVPFSFAWITDEHMGDEAWGAGEFDAMVAQINTYDIDFVLSTGDQIETTGDQTETDAYNAAMANLNVPIFNLRGNHDGSQFTEHFVIDRKGIRIIAFYALWQAVAPPQNNTGIVSEAELAWIESKLQTAGDRRCILAGHYPLTYDVWGHINTDTGGTELLALCNTYDVKMYLSGHAHYNTMRYKIGDDTVEVNGSSAVGVSFKIVEVSTDRYIIKEYGARTPFSVITNNLYALFAGNTFEQVDLLLTPTGDGSAVILMGLTVDDYTLLTLGDNAKFYSDAEGTLDESSFVRHSPTASGRYIRCTDGTATLTIDKNNTIKNLVWPSGADKPSISGDISSLINVETLNIYGYNALSGSINGMTKLIYYAMGDLNTMSGDASLITTLQYLQIQGNYTITLPNVINLKGLSKLYLGNYVIFSQENINQLLADLWANRDEPKPIDDRNIDIRAKFGTPGPSGQGIIDKAALQAYRSPNNDPTKDLWTVTTR